jgi:hypothetical protein
MSIKLGILASSQQQAAPLLLNIYPNAAAAYSLRRLRTLYTGAAIRVSRSSDNAQSDIGFNIDGTLDTTTLLSFCGASNGRIATWYDQSGNARNAIGNITNSPLIVLAGTLYTLNGKPSVYYDNTAKYLITSNFASAIAQPISTYTVSKLASLGVNASIIYDSSTATEFVLGNGGYTEPSPANENLFIKTGAAIGIELSAVATKLVSVLYNTTTTNVFVNGVQKVTNQNAGSNALGGITIGNLRPLGYYAIYAFYGWISELVFYPSLQTGNNAGIQTNINSFYLIY